MADDLNPEVAPATDPAVATPARDEQGRFVGTPTESQTEEAPQEAPKPSRKFKLANDEFELPEELPEEIVQRVAKTTQDLTGAWTRSMQEAAAARKQAQDELQQRAAEWQASQANLDLIAEHKAVAKAVDAYKDVNWQALVQQDPTLAQQHWINYQQLQNQLSTKEREIDGKKQEFTAKQREAFQRAAYEMNRSLQDPTSGVPGWNQDLHSKLAEYATTYGFRPEEIGATLDPRAFRILYKAYAADQALKAAKSAEPAPQPKPVSKVGSTAASGRVDPDKMTTEDWLKWRNNELYGNKR